jgi:hypothetical protein
MNKDYSQIDQILDEIILGKSQENKLAELINDDNRDELLDELNVHQAAAALVQRNAVLLQVSRVHNTFIEKRNGFTADDFPYSRTIEPARSLKFWWRAAAILIIAPLLAFVLVYTTNSSDRLFATQYQTYRINVDRTASQETSVSLVQSYQQGKYEQVVKDYQALTEKGTREKMITAFAHMELKQYEAAVPLLDAVIRSNVLTGERLYQDEAEYYLALSLLKTNQLQHAYQLFDKIYVDDEHTFNGRVDKWFMLRLKWLL